MRSSLKALRSLETIKIFCSNENNNTSLCSRSLMTLFFLFFLSLVLLKIIMFLCQSAKKKQKMAKKASSFLFKKQKKRQNIDQLSTVFSHTKKKEKNSNHFSSWRRVLPPRTTPRSRRYSSRYITKIEVCALLSARAFAFFLFFSLSTEEDRGNHHRRRISWTRLHL